MVNDRWGLAEPDFVTYEYDIPDDPPDGPWELCRGVSHSFCFNQAEEDDDHLTPHEIVDLLTEVVAKGGNFLLNIGPKADGTVPAVQVDRLRAAGSVGERQRRRHPRQRALRRMGRRPRSLHRHARGR